MVALILGKPQASSVFWVVEPSKILSLIYNIIPQKEDTILLENG